MEFEEMKKIWDTQNNEALFVINERALHNRILSKKATAGHVANISELLLILVNAGAGILMLVLATTKPGGNLFLYLMAMWMLVTMLFVLMNRIRRKKEENKFDRTMIGDLNHAIATATYQVRLSQLMRWNILPIGIFLLLSIWENSKAGWIVVLLLILFSLTHYLSGWEHNIYVVRKRGLEMLYKKLKDES